MAKLYTVLSCAKSGVAGPLIHGCAIRQVLLVAEACGNLIIDLGIQPGVGDDLYEPGVINARGHALISVVDTLTYQDLRGGYRFWYPAVP